MNQHPQGGNASLLHSPAKGRGQFQAVVLANIPLCQDHFRLLLCLKHFPPTNPGQFIQISCRDLNQDYNPQCEFDWGSGERRPADPGTELGGPLAFLRRPFSLAGRRDTADGVEVEIIHRVVGVGTDWLAHLKPGGAVFILGPLGNSFQLPAAEGVAVLVGGGVGIPPMLYLAGELEGRKAVAFCGALNRDLVPLTVTDAAPPPTADGIEPLYNIAEFARHGIPAIITTDNGSYGYRGLVTQALERYLDRYLAGAEGRTVIYTCGPEPMMKRVGDIAVARGIECQIAVERAMACGMGTCQSCCIRVRKPDPSKPPLEGKDWCYRLACTDGPVFKAAELLW
jgi:dihydroorotate dehydrogenase electron transfer subunit